MYDNMNAKQQWFESQCKAAGINAEDIFVVGVYATNKDGDFLYSVAHEEGEDTMDYVAACELIDCESTYAEWLLNLMKAWEAGFPQDDEMLTWRRRAKTPWAMAQVFRECVLRNEMLTEESREALRKTPVYGVLEPAEDVDSRRGQFLGLCDETSDSYGLVILPEEVKTAKGYRFALKLVDLETFLEQYSCIRNEGQNGPFQILADLEKCVAREWKKKQKVCSCYAIYMYDEPEPEDDIEMLHNSALFRFSHFEIEDELDENFRTIYACYKEEYDI